MGYHEDLLEQARHLAKRDPRKPRQVNLRRAVSSTYYALFHFLVQEAATMLGGKSASGRALRNLVARSFEHGDLARCAKSFEGGTPPDAIKPFVPHVPRGLRTLCQLFRELQEKRHKADYDLNDSFSRSDVLAGITQVEAALHSWSAIRSDPALRTFLVWMFVEPRLSRRRL